MATVARSSTSAPILTSRRSRRRPIGSAVTPTTLHMALSTTWASWREPRSNSDRVAPSAPDWKALTAATDAAASAATTSGATSRSRSCAPYTNARGGTSKIATCSSAPARNAAPA